jgi:hypothetical protein
MTARVPTPQHADDSTRITSTAVWQALGRLAGSAQVHLQAAELMSRPGPPVKPTDTYPPSK